MSRSTQLLRQWRWWLTAAIAVVAISAVVASQSDDVGSGGAVEATPTPSTGAPTPSVGSPTPPVSVEVGVGGAGSSTQPSTTTPSRAPASTEATPDSPLPSVSEPSGAVRPTTPAASATTVVRSTAVSATSTVPVTAAVPVITPSPPTATPSPVSGASGVDALQVEAEAPRTGYDRDLFPHWSDLDGNGCTTRQDMLFATVIGFPQVDLFDRCVIVEGDWYSVYDGVLHAGQPGDVDVDHVVALAEAWDSGAWAWDQAERRRFANDRDNLLVVTASSNRSKSDRDVGEWRPTRRDSWCLTARITVAIKTRYRLTVDATEARALRDMLTTCSEPGAITSPAAASTVPPVSQASSTTAVPTPTSVVPATTPAGSCVDLDTASTTELERIIHIGPARAAQIVSLRPFASVDDLLRVDGIGPSRLRDIVEQGLVCP